MSLADDFDAIPVKGAPRQIAYSEGPPTAEQAAYPRVEVAGTAADAVKPSSLADEFDAIAVSSPKAGGQADAKPSDVKPVGLMGRVFQGARDPADGLSEMLYNALPKGGQDAYRALANWGADATGMTGRMDESGVSGFLKNNEQQYQAGRLAANDGKDPGFDGGRLTGNILSPVTLGLAAATPTAGAASLGALLARGGVAGAASGLTTPVMNDDAHYWDEKGKQAAAGGFLGAGGSLVGAGLSRVISPKTDSTVKALMDEGITPTLGQMLGKGFAKFEDKLTGYPIIGDMIKNSQRRSIEDFNRAAYNRSLSPLGLESTAKVGRDGVSEVKFALKDAYDNLLPKLNFRADSQFSQEVGSLTTAINNGNVPPVVAKQFESIMKNDVYSRMTKAGTMDGESFKALESKLTEEIKKFGGSLDPAHKDVSAALQEVLNSARSNLARTNPQYAGELGKINEGFANYARIRQAAAGVGAADGIFTPAQLQNAVKAMDRSAGKGNFATGTALMQDLSEGGKSVLGATYPDSGTVGRALATSVPGWLAAAYVNPAMAAGGGIAATAAMAPYSAMGQKLAAALLAKRPQGAQALADAVRSMSPAVAAGLAPLAVPAPHN